MDNFAYNLGKEMDRLDGAIRKLTRKNRHKNIMIIGLIAGLAYTYYKTAVVQKEIDILRERMEDSKGE